MLISAPEADSPNIPEEQLPRCLNYDCGGLLRPGVVWFGETLREEVLEEAGRIKAFLKVILKSCIHLVSIKCFEN